MAIIVKGGGDYENHPEGQYRAVCMDVVDLGDVVNAKWGKVQHKIALVFHTEKKMKDGRPFEVWERFTASLDEKAHLRKFLQGWRGRAFTPEEMQGFDLEKLIGVNAYVQIIHNTKGDKTYANIDTVMLLPKDMPKVEPTAGYERRKDRKPQVSQSPEPVPVGSGYDETDPDDEMPF